MFHNSSLNAPFRKFGYSRLFPASWTASIGQGEPWVYARGMKSMVAFETSAAIADLKFTYAYRTGFMFGMLGVFQSFQCISRTHEPKFRLGQFVGASNNTVPSVDIKEYADDSSSDAKDTQTNGKDEIVKALNRTRGAFRIRARLHCPCNFGTMFGVESEDTIFEPISLDLVNHAIPFFYSTNFTVDERGRIAF